MGHAFRAAVEAKDFDAAVEQLADDVRFASPVVFKPYEGKQAVGFLLGLVSQVFEDFEYLDELHGERNGRQTVGLVFRAHVDGKQVDGWDYLTLGADGKIEEFTVMVRPMSGMHALAEAMKAKIDAAQAPTA